VVVEGGAERFQVAVHDGLDAHLLQVGEQFRAARVLADPDALRPVPCPGQGPAHGVGQEGGQVVDVGGVLDLPLGEDGPFTLDHDQAQVVRLVLRQRLGQRPEVSFPDVFLLGQAVQATLDEGRTLAQRQLLPQRALFDLSPQVREKAVQALAERPVEEYRQALVNGFRYPWPAVADHAAEALVAVKDRDALPALVGLLDQPDPRLPVAVREKGKEVLVTRELVSINHMGSCMLCHTPSLSKEDLVRGRVPIPGEDPPPLYYAETTGLFVRADTTYLRQDFSVVQPVASSGKWPGNQRFDYLLRTRPLSSAERKRFEKRRKEHPKPDTYEQRGAVLFALKELTGKNAGPSSADWKPLLRSGAAQGGPKAQQPGKDD
jgi:hypothetical protein